MTLPIGLFTTPLEDDLLYKLGEQARIDGKNRDAAWKEICAESGYSEGRTPARERFEDGFYGA